MTSSPTFLVVDTETTGADPQKDSACEFGFCATTLHEAIDAHSFLVDPGMPISPEASAVHHLVDDDVRGRPSLAEVLATLNEWPLWGRFDAYVAHNAPFDKQFLPALNDRPWLDTLRMAKRYYPDFPSHSNQALRYRLKLPVPRHLDVHRAAGDCIVTAALLRHLLAGPACEDFERLGLAGFVAHIDSPILLETIGFGQHRGEKWADAEWGYLKWVVEKAEAADPDTLHTAKYWMDHYQPKLLETVGFGKHEGRKWSEVPRDYLAWILRQPDVSPDVARTARHYLSGPRPAPQI